MAIEFGLGLAYGPPKDNLSKWLDELDEIAPELGVYFQSLWMTDHFFWEDKPTYEAWTVMSFLAARYPQFQLGSMVLGQAYRNPALLAKMGTTLQMLSDGRLILGIGAGWKEDEHQAYGYRFASAKDRVSQLEEAIIIIKRLWYDTSPVTFHGQFYHMENAYNEPKPDPIPKIMVGGSGKNTLRVAAQHADWWNLGDDDLDTFKERVKTLKKHCEKIERDFKTIRLTRYAQIVVGKNKTALKKLKDKQTWKHAFFGTPSEVLQQMQAFVEAGVDYFMLDVPMIHDAEARAILFEDVLGKLNAGS